MRTPHHDRMTVWVYILPMADNTKQLAEEFTAMVLDSIKLEESSPTKPRNPTLVAFQIKMPIQLRNRIRKAVAAKGIEQTQLCRHAMHQLVSVILKDQEPGLRADIFELEIPDSGGQL